MTAKFVQVFGVRFLDGEFTDAEKLLRQGGVMVVPSGPGLATVDKDADYYQAVKGSDLALFDSGLLVLLLRVFKGVKVKKLSGLLFLREFLSSLSRRAAEVSLFLVDPSEEESEINRKFISARGIELTEADQYVAPMYQEKITDFELLRRLEQSKPNYILLNIGGGIQEKLAYFLKQELSYKPAIICTGAAIAFLTGRQANIPGIADKLSLGWLVRCVSSPRRFVPRYLAALRLVPVFLRYADKSW